MSEIRVDNITDEAGTGSPSLPNGLVTPSATVSGTLDVASNIQLDSNGISFDSGSNHIDYYEEGTHSSTITTDGDTPDVRNNTLTYIRIGNLVHVVGRIRAIVGGSSFEFTVPFVNGSAGNRYETSNEFQNIRFDDNITFRLQDGNSFVSAQDDGSATGIGSDIHINVNITYITDA